MSPQDPVTAESIDRLCALADLPVPAERRPAFAAMLSGLVVAANELSRKMAPAGHRTVAPILRFPQRRIARTKALSALAVPGELGGGPPLANPGLPPAPAG